MKDSRKRAKIVRRRKVANLAAYSRQHTVRNCVIPKADEKEIIDIQVPWSKTPIKGTKCHDYKIPEKGYKQPKPLMKKGWIVWFTKEDHDELPIPVWERHVKRVKSEYPDPQIYQKKLWKNLGKAAKMELYTQDKLKKWEKKHPKPCPNDDLFKDEFIPQWEHEREEALIRIRDFVVSVYDKLHVVGNRVNRKEGKMVGTTVAEVKDTDGKGHDITYPNLQESDKLYKDATKAAVVAMDKDPTIVDCDLKNHKGDQKRPLIHAKRSGSKNLKQQREFRKAA